MHDVVVVGGSAAGLSAALALGRSRRSVVVIDAGQPRNATSAHMHGVLGHDGAAPADFLARGREDLVPYDVTFVDGVVTGATHVEGGAFEVTLDDGRSYSSRALLAATGVHDELPDIPGLRSRWGIDVLHCPYCHGWEVRDQQIVILATTPMAAHSALLFRQLSAEVTMVLHGARLSDEDAVRLRARGVTVFDGPATELLVEQDQLRGVRLSNGETVPAQALVVAPRADASNAVMGTLGLQTSDHPMGPEFGTMYVVEMGGRTSVPGLWAAGNVVDPVATVPKSLADGYFTGAMINADLVAHEASAASA